MGMPEQQIVIGCRAGEDAARRELYECFAGRLFNICRRYVADTAVAQDILQDAFVRIFTSFDKFDWRGEGSLKAWMERITVNMALEHLRKSSKAVFSSAPDLLARQQYEDPAVEAESVRAVPREVLVRFIEELPSGYRTVFNLYCIEDYSHREIADMLGINEKSSSSQLSRAKALLAARIKEYLKTR